MSTIAAISSPIGAGGIGIVRVSGREALRIADTVFHFSKCEATQIKSCWEPMKLNFGVFKAEGFEDKGYAVFFPARKAYTGEDTVEFYLHGGVRIMQGALDALLKNGAVLAQNGEFTKRAFLSGRITLADAEGVIDMINAESAAGLRAAYRLMNGEVSRRIEAITEELGDIVCGLEAALDYPDEMEDEVLPPLKESLEKTLSSIRELLSTAKNGRIAKHGLTAALVGAPNSGKSSLMNSLLKENRAIVTSVAGTTRDTVSESFECEGVRINLIDTAGIRQSEDEIEKEGILRAKRAAENADVVVHVIDTASFEDDGIEFGETRVFTVYNKCDLTSFRCPKMADAFAVSAKTGENVETLARALASVYKEKGGSGGELITSERHADALYRAESALLNALSAIDDTVDCILVYLDEAYGALGEITGKTAAEDIVNGIFAKFCVGK